MSYITKEPKQIASYEIKSLIAEGGMGSVHKAFDQKLQRDVVIKLMHRELADYEVRIIQVEARALAKVNHPNVMQVYELVESDREEAHSEEAHPEEAHSEKHSKSDKEYALVGEFIDGESLATIQTQRVLSLEQKLNLLKQIADGVQAVHDAGLIHGDLKAANVQVTHTGQVKIIDFGLSSYSQFYSAGKKDRVFFTMGNIAPEQWECLEDPDCLPKKDWMNVKTDLFAFGVLAYELIAGYSPFGSGDKDEIKSKVRKGRFADAKQIYPPLPLAMVELLNELLQTDPELRAESFSEVSDRIQRALQGLVTEKLTGQHTVRMEAESAAIPPPVKKTSKPIIFGAIGLFVTLLLVFVEAISIDFDSRYTIPADVHYVAVLRPKVESSRLPPLQEEVIVAAVDDGIRQAVLKGKDLKLLPWQELLSENIKISEVVKRSSATHVIEPKLNCFQSHCDVLITLFKQGDWEKGKSIEWGMPTFALGESTLEIQNKIGTLFPKLRDSRGANNDLTINIAEQHYQDYLSLYVDIIFKGKESEENLQRLQNLLEQAPELFSGYSMYRRLALYLYRDNNDARILEGVNDVLKRAPQTYRNSVQFTVDQLWIALYSDDHTGAKELILQAEKRGIDPLTLLEMRANYHLENNQATEAIPLYKKALKLRFSSNNQFNLALSYWYTGDYQNVIQTLQQLIKVTPESYSVLQLLGSVYLIQGEVDPAIEVLEKLTEQKPQSMDLNNLAIAYSLKRDFELAQHAALQAVELSPNTPSFLLNLADIEWYLGNHQQAKSYYQKVIETIGSEEDLYSILLKAQAWSHLNESQQAISLINQANQLAPENGEVAFISALVYMQINELVSATAQVEQALKAGVGEAWFNLPWFDELCVSAHYLSLFSSPVASCQSFANQGQHALEL